jgi:hypothetical protein
MMFDTKPTSTRVAGLDTCGEVVRIGEMDTDGKPVGFIDENGLAWESAEEKVIATCAGRFCDALGRWQRHEGEMPVLMDYLPVYVFDAPFGEMHEVVTAILQDMAMTISMRCDREEAKVLLGVTPVMEEWLL